MSRLSPAQVRAALIAAGFPESTVDTMTAIAHAESNFDPNVLGDVSIQTSKWGPSVGLFQIRTLKAETGTGSDRDLAHLQGNVAAQVKAALHISGGGRDFSPWSTYTSGSYRQYTGDSSSGGGIVGAVTAGLGGVVGGTVQPLIDGVESTAITIAFGTLGLALVGLGVYVAFGKQIRAGVGTVAKVAL